MTEDPPVLSCRDLEIGYAGEALLPPIDLSIEAGEFWAVVGRNGSGKSTWFKTMLGLLRPVTGRVERPPDLRLSYVAQRITFDDLYPLDSRSVVALGCLRGAGFLAPSAGSQDIVGRALEAVDATDLARRNFRTLSEGQKQRILLARMVAAQPDVAFLDEPTAAMDAVAEREAMRLIDRLRARYGMAVVVVSHYLEVAHNHADRVLFLDPDAQAVITGSPREVFAHPAFQARYATSEVTDG